MRDPRSTLEQLHEVEEHIRARLRALADEPLGPDVLAEIHDLSSWLDNVEYAQWALRRRRAALQRLFDDQQPFSVAAVSA